MIENHKASSNNPSPISQFCMQNVGADRKTHAFIVCICADALNVCVFNKSTIFCLLDLKLHNFRARMRRFYNYVPNLNLFMLVVLIDWLNNSISYTNAYIKAALLFAGLNAFMCGSNKLITYPWIDKLVCFSFFFLSKIFFLNDDWKILSETLWKLPFTQTHVDVLLSIPILAVCKITRAVTWCNVVGKLQTHSSSLLA